MKPRFFIFSIISILFSVSLFASQVFALSTQVDLSAYEPEENLEPSITLQNDPRMGRAHVAVHELLLDQVFYGAGDTIEGSFKITNIGNRSINNLHYAIELVGNFTNNDIPQSVFDYGTISDRRALTTLETNTIAFSYQLPDLLPANNLGIQIKLYEGSERMLARASQSFGTNGETYDYLEHIVQVQIDGEPFGLLDAPIAYEGERMFFAASLESGTEALELVPEVKVYNRLLSGEELSSFNAATFFINRFDTKEQRIELPHFDYKPGIYTALITYKDTNGIIRSGPFEVRYIISEIKPQIESIAVSESILETGKPVEVTISLSDSPIDIRSKNYEETRPISQNNTTVRITLYDAAGEEIMKQDAVMDELGVVARALFTPKKDELGFRVVADVFDGEKVVDRSERIFTIGNEEKQAFLNRERNNVFIVAFIFFGSLLLILSIVYLVIRSMKKKKAKDAASLFSIAVMLSFGLFGFVAAAQQVINEGFITAYGERVLYIPTNFQINSPRAAEVETYATGEIVPFQVDLWSQNTNASMQDASVRITPMFNSLNQEDVDAKSESWTEWQRVGATRNFDYSDKNIPWTEVLTMQAPDTPGTYRVHFQIKNVVTWTLGLTYDNVYQGYFDVVIVEPEPDAPLPDGIVVEAEIE